MQRQDVKFNEIEYRTVLAPVEPYDQGAPRINGPEIYGASPGKDFLYLIPATGERPLNFCADGLPEGLQLDADAGIISGRAVISGSYLVTLKAENRLGKAEKTVKLVIADNALALTPPMGWNSWNCFRSEIDEEKIRAIAEGMIKSGLAAYGYSYVNLDSGWQSKERGGSFNSIVPTEAFPDMKKLCSFVHAMGLKIGIYSSPYVMPWGTEGRGCTDGFYDTTFRRHRDRYIGIDKHEADDVKQWADWGFDYLKYDWVAVDMYHTGRMSAALHNSPRDFVLSLATRVNFANDAARVGELANLYRSNADTAPTWNSLVKNGFGNDEWNPYIGPGRWFDLDMLATGERDGEVMSENELISHVSCWMMRPTPIMIDCDPATMSDHLKRLLCNEEVIAVNQDILGKPSVSIFNNDSWDIRFKPLADGSCALGFFNLSDKAAVAPVCGVELYIGSRFHARDLWGKRDVGVIEDGFVVGVDAHCAKLYRLTPVK